MSVHCERFQEVQRGLAIYTLANEFQKKVLAWDGEEWTELNCYSNPKEFEVLSPTKTLAVHFNLNASCLIVRTQELRPWSMWD